MSPPSGDSEVTHRFGRRGLGHVCSGHLLPRPLGALWGGELPIDPPQCARVLRTQHQQQELLGGLQADQLGEVRTRGGALPQGDQDLDV